MSNALKVLHVVPDFNLGGAERMAVDLICGLAHQGLDVRAISLYDCRDTNLAIMLRDSGITVWHLDKRRGFDPRMYTRLERLLGKARPDVIHTHRHVLRYLWPLPAYRRVAAKFHTVHNIAEKEVDIIGKCIHFAAFRTGVMPVAIARTVLLSIKRVYGLEQLPLIPNGIPVERYKSPTIPRAAWRQKEGIDAKAVLVVAIGRLEAQKNHALLLEAFAEGPAKTEPHALLLIIGEGSLRPALERHTAALKLDRRIRFLGRRPDISDVLAAADVFVSSSDYEGNPLSVMEAMAAGIPVIATAVGGVPELVEHEVTGIIVQKGDKKALANAMNRLLANANERIVMGNRGAQKAVELFDLQIMVDKYKKLYETIRNQRSRSLSE